MSGRRLRQEQVPLNPNANGGNPANPAVLMEVQEQVQVPNPVNVNGLVVGQVPEIQGQGNQGNVPEVLLPLGPQVPLVEDPMQVEPRVEREREQRKDLRKVLRAEEVNSVRKMGSVEDFKKVLKRELNMQEWPKTPTEWISFLQCLMDWVSNQTLLQDGVLGAFVAELITGLATVSAATLYKKWLTMLHDKRAQSNVPQAPTVDLTLEELEQYLGNLVANEFHGLKKSQQKLAENAVAQLRNMAFNTRDTIRESLQQEESMGDIGSKMKAKCDAARATVMNRQVEVAARIQGGQETPAALLELQVEQANLEAALKLLPSKLFEQAPGLQMFEVSNNINFWMGALTGVMQEAELTKLQADVMQVFTERAGRNEAQWTWREILEYVDSKLPRSLKGHRKTGASKSGPNIDLETDVVPGGIVHHGRDCQFCRHNRQEYWKKCWRLISELMRKDASVDLVALGYDSTEVNIQKERLAREKERGGRRPEVPERVPRARSRDRRERSRSRQRSRSRHHSRSRSPRRSNMHRERGCYKCGEVGHYANECRGSKRDDRDGGRDRRDDRKGRFRDERRQYDAKFVVDNELQRLRDVGVPNGKFVDRMELISEVRCVGVDLPNLEGINEDLTYDLYNVKLEVNAAKRRVMGEEVSVPYIQYVKPYTHQVVLFEADLEKRDNPVLGRVVGEEDSGTSRSLLSKKFCEVNRLEILKPRHKVRLIDGTVVSTVGQVRMGVAHMFHQQIYDFDVMDMEVDMLIGRELLDKLQLRPKSFVKPLADTVIERMYREEYEERVGDKQRRDMLKKLQREKDHNGGFTDEEMEVRRKIKARAEELLRNHLEAVQPHGVCNLPEATVKIQVKAGTKPVRVQQYPIKSKHIRALHDRNMDDLVDPKNDIVEEVIVGSHDKLPEWNFPHISDEKERNDRGEVTKVRTCLDARLLNDLIVDGENFPMSELRAIVQELSGQLASVIDMKSAFQQMEVEEQSRKYLSFTWRNRYYRYKRGAFGVSFMSKAFQRLMQAIFRGKEDFCKIYIDDLIVHTDASLGMEYHLQKLDEVFAALTKANMRVNPDKVRFLMREYTILGYQVTPDGVAPNRKKLEALLEMEKPSSFADLHRFIGLANFFAVFMRHYSEVMEPLNKLKSLESIVLPRKKSRKPSTRPGMVPWDREADEAFVMLKHAMANLPKLNPPDFTKPFCVVTDGSMRGHGSVLFQPKKLGDLPTPETVVAFRSHSWKSYELGYQGTAYRMELVAIRTALEDYKEYLYGGPRFLLLTDCEAMTELFQKKHVDKHFLSYFNEIMEYSFDVKHVKGLDNDVADALSRLAKAQKAKFWGLPAVEEQVQVHDSKHMPLYDLFKMGTISVDQVEAEKVDMIRSYHEFGGHRGWQATVDRLKAAGKQWDGMEMETRAILGGCKTCANWALGTQYFHPMKSVVSVMPWSTIQVDLLTHLNETERGFKYVLVVVDVFTGYCVLRKQRSREEEELMESMFDIFGIFGIPDTIMTDKEGGFTGRMAEGVFQKLRMVHRRAVPFAHRQIGKAESMVKLTGETILRMLQDSGESWDRLLPVVQLSMNTRVQKLNGAEPFTLMFNRRTNLFEPRPEFQFPVNEDVTKWVDYQKAILDELFPAVNARREAMQVRQREQFDASHRVYKAGEALPNETLVMLKDHMRSSKNEVRYMGPFIVTSRTEAGTYLVRDSHTGYLYHRDVVLDEMKFATGLVDGTDDQYLVEELLDSKFDEARQSTMFLVKWKGYSIENATWEPVENISENLVNSYRKRKAQEVKKERQLGKRKEQRVDDGIVVKRRARNRK